MNISFTYNGLNTVAAKVIVLGFVCTLLLCSQSGHAQTGYEFHESERSDKLTGGRIETAEFQPGQPDIRITLNIPSFRLTLWQNGKEVKSWYVGIGLKEFPLYIGEREASEIIWNPDWIPPDSDWVKEKKGITPLEVIKASDPRNPLGKLKIPLGNHYLIHQAGSTADVGSLVSHGCVRMVRSELYDLAEKIIAARTVDISPKRIAAAKRSLRKLTVPLDKPIPVDINYDTLVVEGGVLHIYPDVYGRGMNRPARLRAELESGHVNVSNLSEATMKKMLAKVKPGMQFVVDTGSIDQGKALEDGKLLPVIPRKPPATAGKKR